MSLIHATAKALMDEAENDVATAKRIGRVKLQEDTALVMALAEYALDLLIENEWRSDRASHWHDVRTGNSATVTPAVPVMRAGLLKKGEVSTPSPALQRGLHLILEGRLTYPMPGGTVIGDWTKRDLMDHARVEIAKANAALRNNYWLMAVANMLKRDTDRVRDFLTNADLDRLARQQLGVSA